MGHWGTDVSPAQSVHLPAYSRARGGSTECCLDPWFCQDPSTRQPTGPLLLHQLLGRQASFCIVKVSPSHGTLNPSEECLLQLELTALTQVGQGHRIDSGPAGWTWTGILTPVSTPFPGGGEQVPTWICS